MLKIRKIKSLPKRPISLVALLVGLLFATSCGNDPNALMPNITGQAYEVLVVIEDDYWLSEPGKAIIDYFGRDMDGLPQSEPLFDLVQIPQKAFNEIFKTHRNLIFVKISPGTEKNRVLVRRDVYARHQLVLQIEARSAKKFIELFEKNKASIETKIIESERQRIQINYKKYQKPGISNRLKKVHQIKLTVPAGYSYDMDTTRFAWISHETPYYSQGLLIYYYPYNDTNAFSKLNLVNTRDSVLRKYVHGPVGTTSMTTERNYPVNYREFMLNGNYFTELRGLWKLDGPDFMGGPFVSYSTVDKQHNRIVCVEGYIYAPKDKKRNLVRQMEAIIYSLQFEESAKNTK